MGCGSATKRGASGRRKVGRFGATSVTQIYGMNRNLRVRYGPEGIGAAVRTKFELHSEYEGVHFERNWRARHDSNVRPLDSESSTLSS